MALSKHHSLDNMTIHAIKSGSAENNRAALDPAKVKSASAPEILEQLIHRADGPKAIEPQRTLAYAARELLQRGLSDEKERGRILTDEMG